MTSSEANSVAITLEKLWIERERKQRGVVAKNGEIIDLSTTQSEATKQCRLELQLEFGLHVLPSGQSTADPAQHSELLAALENIVASANPHPVENASMFAAWRVARAAIAKAKGVA